MGRRRRIEPFELEIDALGKGGTGVGVAPDGLPMAVKPAPPGSRVFVHPAGRRKGKWSARRVHMVRPPADGAEPRCAAFGVCGGCTLQELGLRAQRRAKVDWALLCIAEGLGTSVPALRESVTLHPIRGLPGGYGYRNKVELSFGGQRFLAEADHQRGAPIDGRWLGFHAPGRFDRVADAHRCEIMSEPMNALLGVLRRGVLGEGGGALWNARTHEGFWRHAVLRHGVNTGELLAVIYTTSPTPELEARVEALAKALMAEALPDGCRLMGVVWGINDHIADVARGETRRVWGTDRFAEALGDTRFTLGPGSFFQTNTAGAELLYDTIGQALEGADTLYDLYCGAGSIGLYLADRFEQIIGVEEVEVAVQDARANALANGVSNTTYTASRMEHALAVLPERLEGAALVVDPPRAGLHPKVARALAGVGGDQMVYVACKPGSLGRDAAILAEGGWRLTELWPVDLFPQTGHIEVVGLLRRTEASP